MAGPILYLIHSTHTWEALENISTYTCMNITNNNKERERRCGEHVVACRMDHLVNTFMNVNYKPSNTDDAFFDNQNGATNANLSTQQHVGSFKALLELGMAPAHIKNEGALGEFSENQNSNFQEHFKCTVCNKDMGTKAKLVRHMKTHDDAKSKEFRCSICGNMYAHRYNLKRHLRRVHKMSAEEISPALLKEKSQGSTDGFDHVSPLHLDKDDKSELFATYVGENGMFDDKTNILETNFSSNTFTSEFTSGSYSNLHPNSTFGNEFSLPHPTTKKTQPSDRNILNGANEIPPFPFPSLVSSFKNNTSCSDNSTSSTNNRNNSTNSLVSNSPANSIDTNSINSIINNNTGKNNSIFNINNHHINSVNINTTTNVTTNSNSNSNSNSTICTATSCNINNSNKNTATTIHNDTAITNNMNTNTNKINSGSATANSNNNSSNNFIHKLPTRVTNVTKNEEKPKCHVCEKELSTKWSLMRHLAKVHKLDPKPNESTPPSLMNDSGNAEVKYNPDNPSLLTVKSEPGYQPLDTKTLFLDTKADTKFYNEVKHNTGPDRG